MAHFEKENQANISTPLNFGLSPNFQVPKPHIKYLFALQGFDLRILGFGNGFLYFLGLLGLRLPDSGYGKKMRKEAGTSSEHAKIFQQHQEEIRGQMMGHPHGASG